MPNNAARCRGRLDGIWGVIVDELPDPILRIGEVQASSRHLGGDRLRVADVVIKGSIAEADAIALKEIETRRVVVGE